MEDNKLKKINNLYNECKREIGLSNFCNDMTDKISDKKVQSFYRSLSDFFLQEEQKEIVNKR